MTKKIKFTDILLANKELRFQNSEKEKRAAELCIANKELRFQNSEKEKRAAELCIANEELRFQNSEKEKRALELMLANSELLRTEQYQKEYIAGLEQMMYMVSHEVRQPITHLLGLTSLLEKTKASKPVALLLDYIRLSIRSLDNYTRDLTKFLAGMVQKSQGK